MLTDTTVGYVLKYFRYCETFGLVPWEWNKVTQKLQKQSSNFRFHFYVFSLFWYTLECIYSSFVLYKIIVNVNTTFEYTMKVLLHVLSRVAALALHYGVLCSHESLADFFNKACQMNHQFGSTSADSGEKDGLKVVFWSLTQLGYFYPFIPAINYLNEYNNEYYWPSTFAPTHMYQNPIGRLPFILLETYISALSLSSLGVLTLIATLHGHIETYWTTKLSEEAMVPVTMPRGQLLLNRYQQVQVLNLIYNYACRNFVTPLEVLLLQSCHVFINSGIVRLSGTIPVHFSLALILASGTFFTIENIWLAKAGEMNDAALAFKERLKQSRSSYVQKRAAACRLTSLDVAFFYNSEKSAVLSFYTALRDNTLSVLLYESS